MTTENKTKIYNLLKTASDNYYGFASPDFREEINFNDKKEEIKNSQITESDSQTIENIKKSENLTQINTEKSINSEKDKISEEKIKNYNSVFENLNEKIILCNNCVQNIRGKGKVLINPENVEASKILILTEKPLKKEENTLLEKMLSAIQLENKKNCYISSILKCIPTQNPNLQEFEGCRRFIEAEIIQLKPKIILCMGNFSAKFLLNTENFDMRGKFTEFNKIPLFTTFSVEEIIKNSELKRPTWEDLKILKSKLEELK